MMTWLDIAGGARRSPFSAEETGFAGQLPLSTRFLVGAGPTPPAPLSKGGRGGRTTALGFPRADLERARSAHRPFRSTRSTVPVAAWIGTRAERPGPTPRPVKATGAS